MHVCVRVSVQIVLVVTAVYWTREVAEAIGAQGQGVEGSLQQCAERNTAQLGNIVNLVRYALHDTHYALFVCGFLPQIVPCACAGPARCTHQPQDLYVRMCVCMCSLRCVVSLPSSIAPPCQLWW